MPKAIHALMALLVCSFANAAPNLDQFVGDLVAEHDFHGVVLIQEGDEVIYHQAFGQANRQFDIANAIDARFRIASITKLFTATLILKLLEEGRVDLSSPIKTWLPDYAGEGGDKVNIHQLLTHTSGLENVESRPDESFERSWQPIYQAPYGSDRLLTEFCSGPVVAAPGSRFDYNNGEYIILGKIIEAVHGQPYEQVLGAGILEPLGLSDTGMLSHDRIIERLADTYSWNEAEDRYRNDLPMFIENWYAAGAMYSTSSDLLKFANALFGGKLLKPESLKRLLTPELEEYGYGLWIREREIGGEAVRYAVRYGRIRGARTILLRLLSEDLTVIVLSNTNRNNPGVFAAEIHQALNADSRRR